MAVEYSAATISYNGNGSTTTFDFDFPARASEHIEVKLLSPDFIITTLTEGADYTVLAKEGTFPTDTGGTVTYPIPSSGLPALADGWKITITRIMPYTQPDVYPENSALNPKAIENSLDNLEMQIQQINTKAGLTSIYAEQALVSAGKAEQSASKAEQSAEKAKSEADRAENEADEAKQSADDAKLYAQNSQNSSEQAGDYAHQAEQSSRAVSPEAYNSEKTYNFPDVVAYTDGETYRCVGQNVTGENPDTSPNWVRIAGIKNDFWDIDVDGGLMPALNPTYSEDFVLDSNGDIMPREME